VEDWMARGHMASWVDGPAVPTVACWQPRWRWVVAVHIWGVLVVLVGGLIGGLRLELEFVFGLVGRGIK
jgi:hypothetical protein